MKDLLKKYHSIKQHDYKDWGCACLATICKQYGLKYEISKIREIEVSLKEVRKNIEKCEVKAASESGIIFYKEEGVLKENILYNKSIVIASFCSKKCYFVYTLMVFVYTKQEIYI